MSLEFASHTTTHLKDVLRSLRYTLRRSRDTVREIAPRKLPAPASDIALAALGEIAVLALNVEQVACKLTDFVELDSAKPKTLGEIKTSSHREYEFSTAFYQAVKLVLKRLGATRTLVRQSAALSAYDRQVKFDDVYQLAAHLTFRLVDERSITIGQVDDRSSVPRHGLVVVAVFAGILSLLAEKDGADREALIMAATDMAAAYRDKILSLYQTGDHAALAALFERCARHV